MTDLRNDPDYVLRWPPEIFTDEIARLVDRGERFGTGPSWVREVETLLRQAFSSPVPAEDFRRVFDSPTPTPDWAYDEEPF